MKHRQLSTLLILVALINLQPAHAQGEASAAASQEAVTAPASPGAATAIAATVPQPNQPVFDSTALGDSREKNSANAPVISLEDAIALTLQNNPQRAAARSALVAAQARIGNAKSAGGLQVGVSGDAGLNRNYGNPGNGGNNGQVVSNNNTNESATLSASLPIYTGGRVKASTRASQSAARSQAALTLQTEQDLVLNSTTAYLTVLRNAQLLQVADANLAVSRERQRISNLRYEAGAAPRLDVFTANTTLADAVQRRITASNNLALAKAALNILIGRPPETGLRLESIDRLEVRIPLPQDLSNAPQGTDAQLRALADGSRPLLASARANEETAAANVSVVKAQRKPSLGLSFAGLVRNPASILGRFAVSLGLSVAQTIFDSGRARSQIGEAEALLQQNRSNTEVQRLNVSGSIEQQLLALDTAQGSLASADAAVAEAQAALAAAQLGYQAGARTAVDVSDAQAALLTTQTNAVNARFDVAQSQASLSSAVGILTAEGQAAYQQVLQEELKNPRADLVQINSQPKKQKKFLGIF